MQPVAATESISVFLEGLAYGLQHSVFLSPYGEVLSIWNWLGVLVPIQRVRLASAKFLKPSRVVSVPCEQILRRTATVGHHHPFEGAVSLFKEGPVSSKAYFSTAQDDGYWRKLVGVVQGSVGRNAFAKDGKQGQPLWPV